MKKSLLQKSCLFSKTPLLKKIKSVFFFFVPGFFKQLQTYVEEFRSWPMLKLWVGPLPVMVLFHPDSVEVSVFASCLTVMQSSI